MIWQNLTWINIFELTVESKNRLKFNCLPKFQSHNTLRLLLLRVNYIQLQRKIDNFHGLTIKTKRIFGLKLGQIQIHIIIRCALWSAIVCIGSTPFSACSYITAMECKKITVIALYKDSNRHRITEFMSSSALVISVVSSDHRINR